MAGAVPLSIQTPGFAHAAEAAEGLTCDAVFGVATVAAHFSGVRAVWLVEAGCPTDWTRIGGDAELEESQLASFRSALASEARARLGTLRDVPGEPNLTYAAFAAPRTVQAILVLLEADASPDVSRRLSELLGTVFGSAVETDLCSAVPGCSALNELAQVRATLEETCRQYALAAKLANLGVWSSDPETGEMALSDEIREICGVEEGKSVTLYEAVEFFDESERDSLRASIQRAVEHGQSFEVEAPFVTADGEQKWVRVLCESVKENDKIARLYGCLQDITDEVMARDDIVLLASRDYLTEVANRASFTNMVENRIKQFEADVESLFILLIDVDHFKNINDSFGHDVGDNVLREVTRLLCQAVRSHDVVGRLGGDEFGVFVSSKPDPALGDRVAERVLELASESPLLRSIGGGVTLSLGVAQVQARDASFKSMLKAADLALYEAKRAGRNRAERYSAKLGTEYENRERVMVAVDQALRDDAFEPWYQPKLHLKTGLIDGFEALARWRHPTRGVLTPGAFFVALEDVRMSTRISERMLEKAAADCGALKRKLGRSIGRVAVNVTEKMIADPGFPERLADIALANGLRPSEFELEITEAVLLSRNVDDIRSSLEIMNDMGVAISLDDFGTGYASLSHLRAFPIDQLKIDMGFVKDLDTNRESRIISTAVINMAHDLQMEVVAEGVENAAALGLLHGLGCDFVQGFYIGRPAPLSDIEPLLLENWKTVAAAGSDKRKARR